MISLQKNRNKIYVGLLLFILIITLILKILGFSILFIFSGFGFWLLYKKFKIKIFLYISYLLIIFFLLTFPGILFNSDSFDNPRGIPFAWVDDYNCHYPKDLSFWHTAITTYSPSDPMLTVCPQGIIINWLTLIIDFSIWIIIFHIFFKFKRRLI